MQIIGISLTERPDRKKHWGQKSRTITLTPLTFPVLLPLQTRLLSLMIHDVDIIILLQL